MRVTRDITVGDLAIQVKELTLGEIRAWLKESASSQGDVIDATLFEDFDTQDLLRMTSLAAADLDTLTPSELRELSKVCQEINADFFAMRRRVVGLGQQLLSGISNLPSPT
ncbi:MAG: hypothetical protein HYU74_12670 [Dechloromonas sp.]|nr:hypothetical protein [Dechloromonas sp.]